MKTTIALTALVALAGCTQSPEELAKAQKEAQVAYCWQEQGKKSNPPDVARTMAKVCEGMEDELKHPPKVYVIQNGATYK